jgi:uncharacterized protein (TIGR02246 family)
VLVLALHLLALPVLALTLDVAPAQALQLAPLQICSPLNAPQVEGWFERWNQALASGDPAQVAQLYDRHALLLPTLSAQLRDTPEAITAYFATFLTRHPSGTVTQRQIELGCNLAVDAGTYRFDLHDPEARVEARYTFVYGRREGEWRILHHHSSLEPR